MNIDLLGDILTKYKKLSLEQLNEALRIRDIENKNIAEILIELGYITQEQLHEALKIQEYEYNKQIDNAMYKKGSTFLKDINMDFYKENIELLTAKTKNDWDHIKLSTGIRLIDIQHIWLVMLSHYGTSIYMSFDQNTRKNELNNIIKLLLQYAQEHLSIEEALFNFMKYNSEHLKEHKDFLIHFTTMQKKYDEAVDNKNESINSIILDLCEYLRTWILSHIAIHDTKYSVELLRTNSRNEILQNWIEYIKKNKLFSLTHFQDDLYKEIIKG